MLSRAWMEVDLGALVRNARALVAHAGVPLIPMVKADAYGLGARDVTLALERVDPAGYGVATVDEGRELRLAGIERPIILFNPILTEEMDAAHRAGLTPSLGFEKQIRAWAGFGGPYILSIDTGMGRAGVPWREAAAVAAVVAEHPPEAAFTHFHSPQLDDGSMDEQMERFRGALAMLPALPVLHTDGSAAIVRHAASPLQAVRPGIFLYGVGSGPTAAIQPDCVVTVAARIVETRWVEPGDSVSYDATWQAPGRRLIATLPMGYADGYPRAASNVGKAIVRGRIVTIAGRVTMDMIMLDVTDAGAEVGDIATLIGDGSRSGAPIDIGSLADLSGVSEYEIMTGLRGRLTRVYRK